MLQIISQRIDLPARGKWLALKPFAHQSGRFFRTIADLASDQRLHVMYDGGFRPVAVHHTTNAYAIVGVQDSSLFFVQNHGHIELKRLHHGQTSFDLSFHPNVLAQERSSQ